MVMTAAQITIARPTSMEIRKEWPPNFAAIVKVFPKARTPGVIFTYGSALYNPSGRPLSNALLTHEEVHSRQQAAIGVEQWWERYLGDTIFRYNHEREAHVAEYRAVLEGENNRANRRSMLILIAQRLSGPLYGHMITLADAKKMLKHEGKKTT